MLANWVRETISAGGTGNLTLSGAETGFIKFSDFFATSQIFYYSIEDGSSREIGVGHLSDSTTLVRDKILETLVSGTYDNTLPAAITATTSAVVMCSASAQTSLGSAAGYFVNGEGVQHPGLGTDANLNLSFEGKKTYFSPFFLHSSIIVDYLAISITVATSTASLQLGIFDVGVNGKPSTLLASTSPLSITTTGVKSGTITGVTLHPGWYYTAMVSDVTGESYSVTSASATSFTIASNGNKRGTTVFKDDTERSALLSDATVQTLSSDNTTSQPRFMIGTA